MHAADRFLKFAAEYQSMAKISPSRESKATWNGLAQRWAEFAEQFEASPQLDGPKRRRQDLPRKEQLWTNKGPPPETSKPYCNHEG